jgi:hypothetical protein
MFSLGDAEWLLVFFNFKKQSLLSTQASHNVTVCYEKEAKIVKKTQKIDR